MITGDIDREPAAAPEIMNVHSTVHGNDTPDPMFWLDGFDVPLGRFFDASFSEGMGSAPQPPPQKVGESFTRSGHNPAPVDFRGDSHTSPMFAYIVAPSCQWVSHEADEKAVLFSYSDRLAQEELDLFQEDRGNA